MYVHPPLPVSTGGSNASPVSRLQQILLSSGAHLSRYLVQCAIHHFFRAQVSFIKTKWVRTLPLPVFNYFLTLATATFGDFPHGKNEDDGSIFTALLKCSRFPTDIRSGKLDTLQEVLEKYKVSNDYLNHGVTYRFEN